MPLKSIKPYYLPRSFRLSDETMSMLGEMAQTHKRGQGKELEVIIAEAYKEFKNGEDDKNVQENIESDGRCTET